MHFTDLETNINQYFPHLWDFIEAEAPEPGERPQWRTETGFRLNPRALVSRLLNPEQLIGVRFNKETRYALLDIDPGSPYHPNQDPDAIQKIRHSLEDIGINDTVLIQSSFREGIHLYIFLPEAVSTWGLACALRKKLQQEFIIRDGVLEIFPNTKAYSTKGKSLYKGHRLPLQVGSYLLDKDLQPYSDSWETFFNVAERCGEWQDMKLLKKAITKARKGFKTRTSKKMETWRKEILAIIEKGWTAFGQTNMILGYISEYGVVFEGIEEEEKLADYITQKALSLPRIDEFCQHLHEIVRRAKEWAKCTLKTRFWRKAISHPEDRQGTYKELEEAVLNTTNQSRKQEAQAKIQQAVTHLEENNNLPSSVNQRQQAIITIAKELTGTGLSKSTLYKIENLSLWHPNYQKKEEQTEPETCPNQSTSTDPQPPEKEKNEVAVTTENQLVHTLGSNEGFLMQPISQPDYPVSFTLEISTSLSENTFSHTSADFSVEQSNKKHIDTEEDEVYTTSTGWKLIDGEWVAPKYYAKLEEEQRRRDAKKKNLGWPKPKVSDLETILQEEAAQHISDLDEETLSKFRLLRIRLELKNEAREKVDRRLRLSGKHLTWQEKQPHYKETEMLSYLNSGIPELVKEAEEYFSS